LLILNDLNGSSADLVDHRKENSLIATPCSHMHSGLIRVQRLELDLNWTQVRYTNGAMKLYLTTIVYEQIDKFSIFSRVVDHISRDLSCVMNRSKSGLNLQLL